MEERVERFLSHYGVKGMKWGQRKNPDEQTALRVIRGDFGNGADRIKRLKAAGYDPKKIQELVNRAAKTGSFEVTTTQKPGGRVKAKGGYGQKASEDAVRTAKLKAKAKNSTVDSLSTAELRELVGRMQLETQYNQVRPKSNSEQVKRFVANTLVSAGKQQATTTANKAAANALASRQDRNRAQ